MVKLKKAAQLPVFRSVGGLLLSFAGGFVLAGASVAGIASFADIAFAGSLSLPYCAAALAGAIVHGTATGTVGRGIVKLAAMSLIVTAKLFVSGNEAPRYSGIITAVCVMLSGAAVSALIGEIPEKLLFYAFYAALSGLAAYCGAELLSGLRGRKVIELGGLSGCCYAVVYMVYISSLFSLELPAVNAGMIAGTAITLMAAYNYGAVGGIICGALAACGAFLTSPETGAAAAVLPAAGFFSGYIKKGRIFLTAVFFSLACFALGVLTGAASDRAGIALSTVVGAAAFVVLAPHFSDKWVSAGERSANGSMAAEHRRVSFLSDTIEAVRVDSGRISAALSAAAKSPPEREKKDVCRSCARRGVCRRYDIETAGELIPVLSEKCIRKRELAEELEKNMRDRTAEQLMKLRYAQDRSMLNEQLKITAELLRTSAERRECRASPSINRKIYEKLSSHGIEPLDVSAYYNRADRLVAELYFSLEDVPENTARVRDLAADELGAELTAAASVSSSKELRICLYERPEYTAEIYSASVCAEETEVSGDSSSVFTDSEGICYAVLSDGMGSGKSAAVDSHMVIGLFRRLVCGGMDCISAVRLVNSVMVNKSREESFATLDAVRFDPDSCTVTSIKSGAAATLIKQGDSVMKISAPTFPIGINENSEVFSAEHELSENDMIIMFSDGIGENAYLFIKELLLSGSGIKEIVREIASKAGLFAQSPRPDDVTVIGIRIMKSK